MTELELDLLCDERGFLIDSHLWVAEIAEALAAKEGIHLTPAHWEVLIYSGHFLVNSGSHRPIVPLLTGLNAMPDLIKANQFI